MSDFNPYEAPSVKFEKDPFGAAADPLMIVNSCLVLPKGADLPNVCVYSGQFGENVYVKKTLSYAAPWVLVLCVLSPLIGLIAYLITRKSGSFGFYVAPEVKAARQRLIGINWVIMLAAFATIPLAIFLEKPEIYAGLPVLLLVSLIVYFVKIRGAYAGFIDKTSIGLKGIKRPIMQQLVEASHSKPFKGSYDRDWD